MLFDSAEKAVILEFSLHCFLNLRFQESHQKGHQMTFTDQAKLCNHSTDSHKILHFNKYQYALQQNYKCNIDCCSHIQHKFSIRILHLVSSLFALLKVLWTFYILKCINVLNLICNFWLFCRSKILSSSVIDCKYNILLL